MFLGSSRAYKLFKPLWKGRFPPWGPIVYLGYIWGHLKRYVSQGFPKTWQNRTKYQQKKPHCLALKIHQYEIWETNHVHIQINWDLYGRYMPWYWPVVLRAVPPRWQNMGFASFTWHILEGSCQWRKVGCWICYYVYSSIKGTFTICNAAPVVPRS
mgnify:CR=1 FL=1